MRNKLKVSILSFSPLGSNNGPKKDVSGEVVVIGTLAIFTEVNDILDYNRISRVDVQ